MRNFLIGFVLALSLTMIASVNIGDKLTAKIFNESIHQEMLHIRMLFLIQQILFLPIQPKLMIMKQELKILE